MRINRNEFLRRLAGGIDLNKPDPKLVETLKKANISIDDLKKFDKDGDGIISGRKELMELFDFIDSFDRDGSISTFKAEQLIGNTTLGDFYRALQAESDANLQVKQEHTIKKEEFIEEFVNAHIDIEHINPDTLKKFADALGVSTDKAKQILKSYDRDRDGWLNSKETFKLIDNYDRDGNANTFLTEVGKSGTKTKSGKVYEALKAELEANKNVNPFGEEIVKAAKARSSGKLGQAYAFDKAAYSPNPKLSGNRKPDRKPVAWLKDNNKCNQFVGDVLYQAGVKMPTVKQADGSIHYDYAENWPKHEDLFERITDKKNLKPGDIIVIDYPGRGGSSGHVEVVSDNTSELKAIGAHHDGAYETSKEWIFRGATWNSREKCYVQPDGTKIYLLRPTQKLDE